MPPLKRKWTQQHFKLNLALCQLQGNEHTRLWVKGLFSTAGTSGLFKGCPQLYGWTVFDIKKHQLRVQQQSKMKSNVFTILSLNRVLICTGSHGNDVRIVRMSLCRHLKRHQHLMVSRCYITANIVTLKVQCLY